MRTIEYVVFERVNGKYVETHRNANELDVYTDLSRDVCAKKIHQASYIKSIKHVCNYDGTRTYIIFYDNNVKREYTVKA